MDGTLTDPALGITRGIQHALNLLLFPKNTRSSECDLRVR